MTVASQNSIQLEIGKSINSNKIIAEYSRPIEFTFVDDPQWRAALYSITYITDGTPGLWGEVVGDFQKTAGNLRWEIGHGGGVQEYTFKATGFPDTVVTFVAQ